jgi:cystatin-C
MKFKVLQPVLVLIYLIHGFDAQRLLGGVNEVSDSNERQDFANRALDQLEKASNDINARKIVEITNVQKQVVAGIKYTVELKLAVTECLKGVNTEELSNCKENSGI